MINNPLVKARELCGLSQQALAVKLQVSQQFIQRLESGQASSIPYKVSDFFNETLSNRDRRDLIREVLTEGAEVGLLVPSNEVEWSNDIREAYKLYVLLCRKQLPDCRHLNQVARRSGPTVVARALADLLDLKETDYVGMAKKLKIHPFILIHYFKKDSFILPGTLEAAFADTAKHRTEVGLVD